MMVQERSREQRLRRAAERQGYKLVKSRRRDPRALGYGCWYIVDVGRKCIVVGTEGGYPNMDLDAVEEWLTSEREEQD
jgi:hypothetical protein